MALLLMFWLLSLPLGQKIKVSGFWSPRVSPSTSASAFFETMSNCSQNCWIDWNSAALCFKRLFHIGVWTFARFVRRPHLRLHFTKDCFFQSARSGPDCPRWFNFFDRPDCRPESPPIVRFFDPIESRPMDHGGGGGGTNHGRSSRDRHVSGAQVCARQGDLQGTFRGPSGDLQGTFRGPSGDLQGTFRGPSGDLQGTFRGPSGDLQGTFRGPSGDLQGTLRGPRRPRADGFWSATVFQHV